VDLKNKPKDLLELNPYAKVPVLVDDDAVIYESNIINEYLEEKHPEVRLMPEDLRARARVRIWMDYANSRLHATAHEILHGPDKDKAKKSMGWRTSPSSPFSSGAGATRWRSNACPGSSGGWSGCSSGRR